MGMNPWNDEHELFRKSVRQYVDKQLVPNANEWETQREFPKSVFTDLGKLGYLGIRYPEKYGGSELDYWYTMILCEELVRSGMLGLAVDVMVQCEFAINVINSAATEEQKERFLKPAIAGKKLVALGLTEPGGGSDVAGIRTKAVKDGNDYIINGSKTWITNGTRADYVTLAVRTGDDRYGGMSLIIVPTDTPGFESNRIEKIGCHTSMTAELFFTDCRVPAVNLLGEEGSGFKLIMTHFLGERIVLAGFANALMQQAIDMALAYGKERKVFGKSVTDYQIWRHRLADVITKVEVSKQMAYHACDKLNKKEDRGETAAMAKLFATELVRPVVNECFQVFGGYAYAEEYPIARIYRDAGAMTIGAGTSEIMREIIAEAHGFGGKES